MTVDAAPRLLLGLLLGLTLSPAAGAQTAVVLFDEDDAVGADYYDASEGAAAGGDVLERAGPSGDKLPIVSGVAHSGDDSGRLTYLHVGGGAWTMLVGAPGFATLDLTGTDSLELYLNGPIPAARPELPRLALEDDDGHRTVGLPLTLPGLIGLNLGRTGFLPGSDTDAELRVTYVASLPPGLVRPGYPEDLRIPFADVPLDTSTAAIGLPAIPANFRVESATGLQLDFRFRDLDADGTLSALGEYVEVLTPEAYGSSVLRPTWRIEVVGSDPADPPSEGDVFRVGVDNGGVDADPGTWQRFRLAVADFGPLGAFDLDAVRGARFEHGGVTGGERTVWFDAVRALDTGAPPPGPPPPTVTDVEVGDSTVVLHWTPVGGAYGYHVYRRPDPDAPFVRLTTSAVREPEFADVYAANGTGYTYVLRSVTSAGVPGPDSAPVSATPSADGGDPFLDLVARRAFDYFWEEANAANGLVKDRSTGGSPASIAAVGFGLTAITVGIARGWVSRGEGRQRVLNTLRHFWTCPQSAASSGACGYRGFFYHFLDMSTGVRTWDSELSTIDTALLLGGVLDAKQYFAGPDPAEEEIRALADSIYYRVDWTWAAPRPPLVALGWLPESGFLGADWVGYNEAMILYLLGLGSPTHPLDEQAWDVWTSGYSWQTHYGYAYVVFPPLFGHQYSHLWVDFRGIQDAYMRGRGIDYFENSRRATLAQRAYAIANPGRFPNYGADEWGLTASDDPLAGYLAHGAPPPQNDNGTIAPTAPGGSIAFAPAQARAALAHIYTAHVGRLWGDYGLRDAYNVAEAWYGRDFLGIDQGPFVIMIENLQTGAVWERFMDNEDVRRGLDRAGFEPSIIAAEPDAAPLVPVLEAAAPNPARGRVELRYALPAAGAATLTVYDVLGRKVAVLADGVLDAGVHEATFDASALATGVYVVRLRTPTAVLSRKLTVVH